MNAGTVFFSRSKSKSKSRSKSMSLSRSRSRSRSRSKSKSHKSRKRKRSRKRTRPSSDKDSDRDDNSPSRSKSPSKRRGRSRSRKKKKRNHSKHKRHNKKKKKRSSSSNYRSRSKSKSKEKDDIIPSQPPPSYEESQKALVENKDDLFDPAKHMGEWEGPMPFSDPKQVQKLSELMTNAKKSDWDIMKANREARKSHAGKLKASWQAKHEKVNARAPPPLLRLLIVVFL